MATTTKFMYSDKIANKLPGSNTDYFFRTRTSYEVDGNGKPTGAATTVVYYAPKPGARTSDGKTWTNGTADSLDNFDRGGWVPAAVTLDGGKTYIYREYDQSDVDRGIVSADKIGTPVLGATAQQSLSTSGGRFSETIQNTLINTAANTQPGLAQVVSAKQKNISQPTADEQNAADVNAAVGGAKDIDLKISAKSRSGYGNYYYPSDLASNKQDRIKFTMKTSEGSVISTKNFSKAFSRKSGTEITGSVTLPIQPSISDDNTVDWSGATLNPISAYAAGASIALQPTADMGQRIGDIMGTISKELKDYKNNKNISDAMKVFFAQEAVGVQGLLSRATGAVLNPNLELLFNGPSLRPFGFTFKMSPRDATEAIQVKNIIRFFKQGMAVKRGENAIFLKSPNVFDISYQTYDKKEGKEIPHPSIGRIKTCALMGCSVDYAPDNTYMTFDDDDRTMTSYQMTLRFSELDPIYESDYSDSTGKATKPYDIGPNEIGF